MEHARRGREGEGKGKGKEEGEGVVRKQLTALPVTPLGPRGPGAPGDPCVEITLVTKLFHIHVVFSFTSK